MPPPYQLVESNSSYLVPAFFVSHFSSVYSVDLFVVTYSDNSPPISCEELCFDEAFKKCNALVCMSKLICCLFAFQEWGDRSMLATIALGAAQVWILKFIWVFIFIFLANNLYVSTAVSGQSPWGVAIGAIVGHLVATSLAILGGAFLANYISEKLVRPYSQSYTVYWRNPVIWFVYILLVYCESGWVLGWSFVHCLCCCHIFWSLLVKLYIVDEERLFLTASRIKINSDNCFGENPTGLPVAHGPALWVLYSLAYRFKIMYYFFVY